MNRTNPAQNPITFLSCTGEDEEVEWMKDFGDESREVLGDQGEALPYTRGFWLICQLVAAMNPDDLDAMDESVPFTKQTLDNLLGIQHNEQSYRYYFDCFIKNQQKRTIGIDNLTGRQKASDVLKKNTRWNYQEFLKAPVAKHIPLVQQFTRQMAQVN